MLLVFTNSLLSRTSAASVEFLAYFIAGFGRQNTCNGLGNSDTCQRIVFKRDIWGCIVPAALLAFSSQWFVSQAIIYDFCKTNN